MSMDSDRSQSRICLVTGAAAGLGLSIAQELLNQGDTVVLVDRDQRGSEIASGLDGDAHFFHVDVSDEAAVEALQVEMQDRFGRLDVLVNNAGVAPREGGVLTISRKQWDLCIAVNLTSVYLMCHYLVPLMAQGSSIVNVSSGGALRTVPGTDAYLAAKGGVIALTKAMAVSLASAQIRVNVICPAAVETIEVAGRAGDPRVQAMRSRLGPPLGRGLGQPSEVAGVVAFLCSDRATYINGAVVPIDGGATC